MSGRSSASDGHKADIDRRSDQKHRQRMLSFPKISSVQIRALRQNQRIIRHGAWNPSFACNVRRRHVQAATQARN